MSVTSHRAFERWQIQTSQTWEDINELIWPTHIPIVDRDHKQITCLALELHSVFEKTQKLGDQSNVLEKQRRVLKRFIQYIQEHFEREELIAEFFGLEAHKIQKEENQKILEKMYEVFGEIEEGKKLFNNDLKLEILDWIIQHINQTDAKCFQLENWRKHLDRIDTKEPVFLLLDLTDIVEVDEKLLNLVTESVSSVDKYHLLIDDLFDTIWNLKLPLHESEKIFLEEKAQEVKDLIEKLFQQGSFETFRGDYFYLQLVLLSKHIRPRINLDQQLSFCFQKNFNFQELNKMIKKISDQKICESHQNILKLLFHFPETASELMSAYEQYHTLVKGRSKLLLYKESYRSLKTEFESHVNLILEGNIQNGASLRNRLVKTWVKHVNEVDYSLFNLNALKGILK